MERAWHHYRRRIAHGNIPFPARTAHTENIFLGKHPPNPKDRRCCAERDEMPLQICGIWRGKENYKTRLPKYAVWRLEHQLSNAGTPKNIGGECNMLLPLLYGIKCTKSLAGNPDAPFVHTELWNPPNAKPLGACAEGPFRPVKPRD